MVKPPYELERVVSELVQLLGRSGYANTADWLAQRLTSLRDPQTTWTDREDVAAELHRHVTGMGGLMDMLPRPDASLGLSRVEAEDKFYGLADQLYDLTKPQ